MNKDTKQKAESAQRITPHSVKYYDVRKLERKLEQVTAQRDELREALKEMLESYQRDNYYDTKRKADATMKARAAIAKAEKLNESKRQETN